MCEDLKELMDDDVFDGTADVDTDEEADEDD